MGLVRDPWRAAIGPIVAAVLGASIWRLGNVQFGGFDGSILINHAWQLHLGYRPYVDVVTGLPPIFLLGARLAFDLGGVRWGALVTLSAVFSAVTFLVHLGLLRRLGLAAGLSMALALATQCTTILPVSWWWYNQITAVAGCLVVTAALVLCRQPESRFGLLMLGASTSLVLLSKPNVAAPLIVALAAALLPVPALRRRVALALVFGAGLGVVLLYLSGTQPQDVLASYRYFAGGAFSLGRIKRFLLTNDRYEAIQTFVFLAPCVAALAGALLRMVSRQSREGRLRSPAPRGPIASQRRAFIAVGVAAVGMGGLAMMTNNDFNMCDASLVLLGATALALGVPGAEARGVRQRTLTSALVLASIVMLAANGIRHAVLRTRVYAVGPGVFYEDAKLATIATQGSLFQGVAVGPRLLRVLQDLDSVLEATGAARKPGARVFFGPRIDFAYASHGLRPYPGLPTWWEFFSRDGQGRTDEMVERFVRADFDLCIFLRHDTTFLPAQLVAFLARAYEVREFGELSVFSRRRS